MVGSYSSTKWFWINWMVRALLPTPPAENDSQNLELVSMADRAGELSLQVLQLSTLEGSQG